MPLMKEKNYLPDEFTIEYDVFGDVSKGNIECEMGFGDDRTFIGRHWISKDEMGFRFEWDKPDNSSGSQSETVKINGNEWNHISSKGYGVMTETEALSAAAS
jgi:hypothetical protein